MLYNVLTRVLFMDHWILKPNKPRKKNEKYVQQNDKNEMHHWETIFLSEENILSYQIDTKQNQV